MTEILNSIALILNIVVLFVVVYQTYLTRKSLEATNKSISEDKKTRQIEMLPRAYFVFEARYCLEKWRQEIEQCVLRMEKAVKYKNIEIMKELSKEAIKSPEGLVDKSFYEKAPPWLAEICLSGAKYYYDFHAPMKYLWVEKEQKPFCDLGVSLIERGKEHLYCISDLLSYINQIVPESYAQTPDNLRDSDFLLDE